MKSRDFRKPKNFTSNLSIPLYIPIYYTGSKIPRKFWRRPTNPRNKDNGQMPREILSTPVLFQLLKIYLLHSKWKSEAREKSSTAAVANSNSALGAKASWTDSHFGGARCFLNKPSASTSPFGHGIKFSIPPIHIPETLFILIASFSGDKGRPGWKIGAAHQMRELGVFPEVIGLPRCFQGVVLTKLNSAIFVRHHMHRQQQNRRSPPLRYEHASFKIGADESTKGSPLRLAGVVGPP